MEPEGSSPHSKECSTYPYPEPHQSSEYHPKLSLQDPLGFPSCSFFLAFPTKITYAFLVFSIRATFPIHLILLYLTNYTCDEHKLCSFLQPPATSSLLVTNILLTTLILCSSLNVRDQVSHRYRTTGKTVVPYILIFKFLDIRREGKMFWTEWQQTLRKKSPVCSMKSLVWLFLITLHIKNTIQCNYVLITT
jgi:hypothetical protein